MSHDFLTGFPYDIRRGHAGAFVDCLRQEGTFALSPEPPWRPNNELVETVGSDGQPINLIKPLPYGHGIASAVAIVCFEDPNDWATNNLVKVAEFAKKGLDRLPTLGHKFMITWRDDEYMFDSCLLITTEHSDWWQKYELIHEGGK